MNEKTIDTLTNIARGGGIVGGVFIALVLFGLFDVNQWIVAVVSVIALALLIVGFAKSWFDI